MRCSESVFGDTVAQGKMSPHSMSVPNLHNFSLWTTLRDNANGNNHHTEDDMKESIWDSVSSAYH
jgi:hypothetical protein